MEEVAFSLVREHYFYVVFVFRVIRSRERRRGEASIQMEHTQR